jgi:O-antigen/teichoic acid export membrane protein
VLKRFIKVGSLYVVSSFLARGIGVLLLPLYARHLSPAEYGAYDLILTTARLATLFLALELIHAVGRLAPSATDRDDAITYASTAFWLMLGSVVAGTLLLIPVAEQVGRWFLPGNQDPALAFLAVALVVATAFYYHLQNQLLWEQQARKYAISNVLLSVVVAATAVVTLVVLDMNLAGVLVAMVLGTAAAAAYSGYYCLQRLRRVFSRRHAVAMLHYSLPLVLVAIATFVTQYADRYVLNEIGGLSEVGAYAVGARVASIATLIVAGLQSALTPMVFARLSDPNMPNDLSRLFRLFVGFTALLVLGLTLFEHELLWILVTAEFAVSPLVVPLLAIATALGGVQGFAVGLYLRKQTGRIAIVALIAGAANVALSFLLVPRLGATGAAAAAFLAVALQTVLLFALSRLTMKIWYPWKRIGAQALLLIAGLVAAGLIESAMPGSAAGLVLKLAVMLLVAAPIAALASTRIERDGLLTSLRLWLGRQSS